MFTAVCSVAAIQGRHFFGQVSESSEAPTAHSPPMPRAERKRQTSRCVQSVHSAESPVKPA